MIVRSVKSNSALPEPEMSNLFDERAPQYRKLSGFLQGITIRRKKINEI